SSDLGHLLQGFLTGYVQGRVLGGELTYCLQQQGTFTCARVATHEYGRAFHKTAAQYPVEFLHAGADAGLFGQADFVQAFDCRQAAGVALEPGATGAFTRAGYAAHFADGVPFMAGRALALPLGIVRTAFGADVGGFYLCHQASFLYFMRLGCMAESPLRFLKSAS